MDPKETIEQRVSKLFDDVLAYMTEECHKHGYTGAELYMTLRKLTAGIQRVLGPEAVKQIEKSFILIDKDEIAKHTC